MVSPHSDAVVPHSERERDARLLTRKIVERLRALGTFPSRFGIDLDHDGFWFTAEVNGKTVSARTGQGNFTYEQIAKDLQLASIDPGWDRLTIQKGN
jgi:hypothetical protein